MVSVTAGMDGIVGDDIDWWLALEVDHEKLRYWWCWRWNYKLAEDFGALNPSCVEISCKSRKDRYTGAYSLPLCFWKEKCKKHQEAIAAAPSCELQLLLPHFIQTRSWILVLHVVHHSLTQGAAHESCALLKWRPEVSLFQVSWALRHNH